MGPDRDSTVRILECALDRTMMGETYTRGLLQNRLVLTNELIKKLPYYILGFVTLLKWLERSYKAGIIPLATIGISG
jgi:hypothetical protein